MRAPMFKLTSALVASVFALFVVGACGTTASPNPVSQCRARETQGGQAVTGGGCVCGTAADQAMPTYPTLCSNAAVGGNAICCKSATSCSCVPAQCGYTIGNSFCACGSGIFFSSKETTCTGKASMCCTQNTGYCYCEAPSAPLMCPPGATQVLTCE
jgi:hypothetical protein